jgi:hypothetical protein
MDIRSNVDITAIRVNSRSCLTDSILSGLLVSNLGTRGTLDSSDSLGLTWCLSWAKNSTQRWCCTNTQEAGYKGIKLHIEKLTKVELPCSSCRSNYQRQRWYLYSKRITDFSLIISLTSIRQFAMNRYQFKHFCTLCLCYHIPFRCQWLACRCLKPCSAGPCPITNHSGVGCVDPSTLSGLPRTQCKVLDPGLFKSAETSLIRPNPLSDGIVGRGLRH